MPVTSQAQFKKFQLLLKQGQITRKQFNEWTRGVNYKRLPARVNARTSKVKSVPHGYHRMPDGSLMKNSALPYGEDMMRGARGY